ncbi:MAG: hypothetical protein JXA33_21330 [Anaerolineae bacterium]|nr:hypothetical protein [Anaerolineae bacterium]
MYNPDTASPFYGTAFVLTGDAGEIDNTTMEATPPSPVLQATLTPTENGGSSGGLLCAEMALPLVLVMAVGVLKIKRGT